MLHAVEQDWFSATTEVPLLADQQQPNKRARNSTEFFEQSLNEYLALRMTQKLTSLIQLILPTLRAEAYLIDPATVEHLIHCALNDADCAITTQTAKHEHDYGVAVAVIAMEYMERFILAFPFDLCTAPPYSFFQNLLCAGFLLAVKQLDDCNPSTERWSTNNGLLVGETLHYETLICKALDWHLMVCSEAFHLQYASLLVCSAVN